MRPLLTPSEMAEWLGVTESTLADWRYRRIGPPFVRVGRHVRYDPEGAQTWLSSQTITAGPR